MVTSALLAAGSLTLGIATGVRGETAQNRPELTVLVYTERDVAWLAAAQALVGGLYQDAGIHLAWVPCGTVADPPSCSRPPAANEIVVRIIGRRLDQGRPKCGVALHPRGAMASHITLFLDCLAAGAEEFRIDESIVAGYCLAHEIAHVLLGTRGHAGSGIMQARLRPIDWERAARGGLRFLPGERRQMADAARRRVANSVTPSAREVTTSIGATAPPSRFVHTPALTS